VTGGALTSGEVAARRRWAGAVLLAVASTALVPLAVAVPPRLLLAALVAAGLVALAYTHPPAAAYLLVVVTPVTAGVARGLLVPLVRPHEALGLVLGTGIALRALAQLRTTGRLPLRLGTLDVAVLGMAATSSVLPLVWLWARGLRPTGEDLLYATTVWKFYGLFVLIRASVRTERQVRRCLQLSVAASAVMAVVAILQSLELAGVPELVASVYATDEPLGPGQGRGTSTLGSSIAVGDVMAVSLAVCVAWLLLRVPGSRRLFVGLAVLFVFGGLASGQFSGLIALAVSVFTLAVVTRRTRRLMLAVLPASALAAIVMKPVIDARVADFDISTGLPQSWTVRLDNLRLWVWPRLFSGWNWVFGVRPSARIPVAASWGPFIYIESGHTWLLWTGGVPFLAAFLYFSYVAARTMARLARTRGGPVGVAATAGLVSVLVVFVLMAFDPHLTMRGSADLLFTLLGLATAVRPGARHTPTSRSTGTTPAPDAARAPAGRAGSGRSP
jgi:hypothetical protein